ncbi:hypothetical protein S245_043922 [Arachis hypogaea]
MGCLGFRGVVLKQCRWWQRSQNQLGPSRGRVSFKQWKGTTLNNKPSPMLRQKGAMAEGVRGLQQRKGAVVEGASAEGLRGTVSTRESPPERVTAEGGLGVYDGSNDDRSVGRGSADGGIASVDDVLRSAQKG